MHPTDVPKPFQIVTGEPDDAMLIPDLSPVYVAPERGIRAWRRAAFDWRVFAAVIAASSVAMAGSAGAVWASHHVPHTATAVASAPRTSTAKPAAFTRAPATIVHTASTIDVPRAAAPSSAVAPVVHRPSRAARTVVDTHVANSGSPAASEPNCTARCNGNVACILACPYDGHPAGYGMVAERPTDTQVAMVFQRERGAAMMCTTPLEHAPASVAVRVAFDRDGEEHTAHVEGPLAGTVAGRCIEHAFTSARVPAFSAATFEATRSIALE